jgi:hypothetical protein
VPYLSKQPDAVSQGWLPCLSALAATAVLVAKTDKLTLGQELTVQVPHFVLTLMENKQKKLLVNKLPNGQISKHVM